MRVRVVTGAEGLVLWQAWIMKKTKRHTPPCAKRRTWLRHETEIRFSRVLPGYAICHPHLGEHPDDKTQRSNVKPTSRLKLRAPSPRTGSIPGVTMNNFIRNGEGPVPLSPQSADLQNLSGSS